MFNLDKFISDSVTYRPASMFLPDIEANKETLTKEIKGKKVCVIGGAGSIGSSFIMVPFDELRVNRLTIKELHSSINTP